MIGLPEKDSLELHLTGQHPWWPLISRLLMEAVRLHGLGVVPHIELTATVGGVEQRFLLAHEVSMSRASEPEEVVYKTRWRMVSDEDVGG